MRKRVSSGRARSRLPLLTMLKGGVAVVGTAVVLLLGAGVAFAGWSATPSRPNPAALTAVRKACGELSAAGVHGELKAASVQVAETRGPFAAIVYQRSDRVPWQCVTRRRAVLLNQVAYGRGGPDFINPAAGHVTLPLMSRTLIGAANAKFQSLTRHRFRGSSKQYFRELAVLVRSSDSLLVVSGFVGRGVRRVTFVLRDGSRVDATVGNGRYLAWWPGDTKLYGTAFASILVTTASGTAKAPYSASSLFGMVRPCFVVLC